LRRGLCSQHLSDLWSRPREFDLVVVDRFLAGAFLPASLYLNAQGFRSVFRNKMRELFDHVDVILAPTSCVLLSGWTSQRLWSRRELPSRASIGVFTQPLSIGLPMISVPVFEHGQLPLGVKSSTRRITTTQ
jgi:Asp-tRNA(Asn)/Glu-tRNA(Gln) amidotransferase A subunit family amidase